jgi:hypothetical protein
MNTPKAAGCEHGVRNPPTHDLAALLVAEDFVLITAKKKTLPLQRRNERPNGRRGGRSAKRRRLRKEAL